MKRAMKRLFCIGLTALLLPLGATRADGGRAKEEVVYGTLHNDGSVSNVTVVNIFEMGEGGTLEDYGAYESVENLSSTAPVLRDGDRTLIENAAGRFYYQGVLETPVLPWNVSVIYSLNFEPVEAEALAGKSGTVGVRIRTERNAAVDAVYYDNYMLQISVTLDAAKCTSIRAEGATVANAGGNKQITFTVMPGKDGDCALSADAVDFEMDGVSINAVPLSMSIEAPDTTGIKEDIEKLTDAVTELDDGVGDFKRGVKKLRDGTIELAEGSNELNVNLGKFPYAGGEMKNGSYRINQSLAQMLLLAPSAVEAGASLSQIAQQAGVWLQTGTPEQKACAAQILTLLPTNVTTAVTNVYTLAGYVAGDGTAANPGLASSYDDFHTGLVKYVNGVTAVSENYGQIDSAIGDVRDGLKKLAGGASELKEGTGEMAEETADMDGMIDEKIDELISDYDKSDVVPASFTSEKNTAKSVQFVIRTDGIEKAEEAAPATEAEEPQGFFARLLALFR